MLSEEAGESVNKFVKAFQIAHARQDTVEHRNFDVFMRMIARSDPEMHAHLDLSCQPSVADEDSYPQEVLDLCRDSDDLDWETDYEIEE